MSESGFQGIGLPGYPIICCCRCALAQWCICDGGLTAATEGGDTELAALLLLLLMSSWMAA